MQDLGVIGGYLYFSDGVVTGMYPTMKVVSKSYDGWTFAGEFRDDGTLAGQWHTGSAQGDAMSLSRGKISGTAGCPGR